ARKIYPILGDAIYGENDETLEHVVGVRLAEKGLTVAAAESCTGGLVAHRITGVPGSSRYFRGGIVAYSNDVKTSLLGVSTDLIEQKGAVSEEVARAMAEGVRRVCATDVAVSTTGIAGPDGGSDEKPVGLTFIAVAGPDGVTGCRRYTFNGDRGVIQARAAHAALEQLRRTLLAASSGRR
ncbi:MAG: nicotinamide-nucleotide amidohydrolase family protein, partial [Alkalispirochaeta sp.]